MIGGGSPRVLGLAGKLADIVSINFDNSDGKIGEVGLTSGTADGTDQKLDWIRAGAGDRFADLEIEIGAYFTVVTDNTEGTLAAMAPMMGLEPDVLANASRTPSSARSTRSWRRCWSDRERYGTSYVTVGRDALDSFAPGGRGASRKVRCPMRTTDPLDTAAWLVDHLP